MVKPVGSSQGAIGNVSSVVGSTPEQEGQEEILDLLLCEMYTCRLKRNQDVSREVLTKRHNVLDLTRETKVEC